MKSQEEMMAYFRSMPKKEHKNPYWEYKDGQIVKAGTNNPVTAKDNKEILLYIRDYFRKVFESFHSEAQVLCVTLEDAEKLEKLPIPRLTRTLKFGNIEVATFVLPQVNTAGNSSISEVFWQKYIVEQGIIPVVRIHSHHILDAYQSATDYSTLNSNSLEMVIGHVTSESLFVAYWLDEHGKDTKSNVFQELETENGEFVSRQIHSGYSAMNKNQVAGL